MASKRQIEENDSTETKKIKTDSLENCSVKTTDPSSNESPNLENDDEIFPSNDDERCMIHIGDDIYVTAKVYNDKLQLHIRHYHRIDSQLYPTKKGVTLSPSRWLVLEDRQTELTQFFDEFYSEKKSEEDEKNIHLGGGIYVTTNDKYPVVNIRHWWKPEDATKPCPTKKGVILNKNKWTQLKNTMAVMRDFVPELNDIGIGCIEDHANQMGMLQCPDCNPFDYGQYL